MRVLLLGESWFIHSVHQKGFDSFTTSEYQEGGAEFKQALRAHGWDVDHVPAHAVATMDMDSDSLSAYDCVVISDVGTNTFLLTPGVFAASVAEPNRLEALRAYVVGGGGLLMVGGYMSFAGVDGRARYSASPLASILPVGILDYDDRVEVPQGAQATAVCAHPALPGTGEWPALLGYNRTEEIAEGLVLVRIGQDPLVAVREVAQGRTAAFTSDLAPHWAPPAFLAWEGYGPLWVNLIAWLARQE